MPVAQATDEVMEECEKLGITLSDLEISEDYRDQNPCPTTGESQAGDVYFPATSDPKDYVFLNQNN
ncbi:hypothetical protein A2773_01690 [Candidatus Gottesmanbacteria bacterium RIFCSPHIGHO2_01_FULL_39_10]|uniref:Uncharacterized protein n=1 Tax=Candidatus Gottesmanbacteria bacterium RIFCSPHIGHO2_01_FULL_39_10 TaxID=1798375 RepID=A0A1F5ZLC7_9BACT|nr:MAG: hypothetical protein A2773_01690 [Candidatus Gottesmanbacteria bacterium RIFCSPHIGHO2_01_FULL_39_10]